MRWMASGANDRRFILWKLPKGKDSTPILSDIETVVCIFFSSINFSDATHTKKWTCCDFDPQSKRIVAGSYGTHLYQSELSGRRKSDLRGHANRVSSRRTFFLHTSSHFRNKKSQVRACKFSNDGRLIISASEDRTVRVWNAETNKCIAILRCDADRVRES